MPHSDSAFDDALTKALTGLNVPLDPVQFAACRAHFERVLEANRTMNLTRITEPTEAAVKHFADSLAVVRWAGERNVDMKTVLDVGTGAGFPAVPLAIARRDWAVTAIDATAKKIRFLRSAVVDLGLNNLDCIHAHSNHPGSRLYRWKPGRGFDLVVTRALATLPRALAQTAAFVAAGGWFIAYKTAAIERSEEEAAKKASAKYGLELRERYAYELECGRDTLKRVLHVFRKQVPHSSP